MSIACSSVTGDATHFHPVLDIQKLIVEMLFRRLSPLAQQCPSFSAAERCTPQYANCTDGIQPICILDNHQLRASFMPLSPAVRADKLRFGRIGYTGNNTLYQVHLVCWQIRGGEEGLKKRIEG